MALQHNLRGPISQNPTLLSFKTGGTAMGLDPPRPQGKSTGRWKEGPTGPSSRKPRDTRNSPGEEAIHRAEERVAVSVVSFGWDPESNGG